MDEAIVIPVLALVVTGAGIIISWFFSSKSCSKSNIESAQKDAADMARLIASTDATKKDTAEIKSLVECVRDDLVSHSTQIARLEEQNKTLFARTDDINDRLQFIEGRQGLYCHKRSSSFGWPEEKDGKGGEK